MISCWHTLFIQSYSCTSPKANTRLTLSDIGIGWTLPVTLIFLPRQRTQLLSRWRPAEKHSTYSCVAVLKFPRQSKFVQIGNCYRMNIVCCSNFRPREQKELLSGWHSAEKWFAYSCAAALKLPMHSPKRKYKSFSIGTCYRLGIAWCSNSLVQKTKKLLSGWGPTEKRSTNSCVADLKHLRHLHKSICYMSLSIGYWCRLYISCCSNSLAQPTRKVV